MGTSLLQLASDYPSGAKAFEEVDELTGFRLLVTKGLFGFCAYVGAPADMLLPGAEDLNAECHYGINFREWGSEGTVWEPGWFWWGWDFQHGTDVLDIEGALTVAGPLNPSLLDALKPFSSQPGGLKKKEWTLDEVVQQTRSVARELHEQLSAGKVLALQILNESVTLSAAHKKRPQKGS